MFYLTKEFRFEAAHHLLGYDGACANVHGHSYKLHVTVGGDISELSSDSASDCMVMDFKDLKFLVDEKVIKKFDHQDLNVFFKNPTAEVIANHIYWVVRNALPAKIKIVHIKLWETETSFVEFGDLSPGDD